MQCRILIDLSEPIVIYAPTATGKSEFSVCLALKLGGEIVSADSMSVYRCMNIGTAKPLDYLNIVRHHLIDIVEPGDYYDAKRFEEDALRSVELIKSGGKLPLVVGGSYLYLQSLLYGLAQTPEPNWTLRERLYGIGKLKGSGYLYRKLACIDRNYARKIHENDLRRIVRALEVFIESGRPFSSFHRWGEPKLRCRGFYLYRSWESLSERIERRVEDMFKKGLVEEVEGLLLMGFKSFLTSSQAIGYKEVIPYLEGKISLEEAKARVVRNTKKLAKRQIRWAKGKDFEIIDLDAMGVRGGVQAVIGRLGGL